MNQAIAGRLSALKSDYLETLLRASLPSCGQRCAPRPYRRRSPFAAGSYSPIAKSACLLLEVPSQPLVRPLRTRLK